MQPSRATDYASLVGVRGPAAAPVPPQIAMTGQSSNAPAAGDSKSLTNWRQNPALWFGLIAIGAMWLARRAGFVRGR